MIRALGAHCQQETDDLKAEGARRHLNSAHFQYGVGRTNIKQDRQPAQTRDDLPQDFEPLTDRIG
jgi:hypothetical protein